VQELSFSHGDWQRQRTALQPLLAAKAGVCTCSDLGREKWCERRRWRPGSERDTLRSERSRRRRVRAGWSDDVAWFCWPWLRVPAIKAKAASWLYWDWRRIANLTRGAGPRPKPAWESA